jgi:uncharacterized protein
MWCTTLVGVRRATITIDDELATELDEFVASMPATPSLAAVVQAALRRFLHDGHDGSNAAPLLLRVIRSRRAIEEAASDHGASNVRLFGSVARGEEAEGSDIDLLVTLEPGRTLFDLARLRSRLEEILDAPVDVVPDTNMDDALRAEVEQDAIRL